MFAELDDLMQQAADRTDDPFDGLRLRGLAYAEFALANPEQYRIAMMRVPTPGTGGAPFSAEDIVAGPTFHHLIEAVQACIEVGVFAPGSDPRPIATSLWAAAHGAVSLCLAKPGLADEHAVELCELVITQSGLGAAMWSHLAHDHDDSGAHERSSADLAALLRRLG